MANLSTRELFARLRGHFSAMKQVDATAIAAFEYAVTETLFDLADGTAPEPKKRPYVRKAKPPATT